MEQEKIKLSSVEATAYWWVNVIKNKVKEILKSGTSSKDEKRFAKIFFRYTEREYRILYLELIKYIEQDMINHIMNSGENVYHQDTDIMGHNDINKALFKITNCSIPDIRIVSNNSKDVVTYTNLFQATV